MGTTLAEMIGRFDQLPRDEQWKLVVALLERIQQRPRRSVMDFQPHDTHTPSLDAQERVRHLRGEWLD